MPFFRQHHADGLEDEPDEENQKQFGHITDPGSESV